MLQMTRAKSTLLEAALWYADLGYPVFPCAPDQKRPLTEHGLLDATTDPEQIERWWTQHPSANVAIRTDGLVAIDLDGSQNAWMADAPDKLVELGVAAVSLTPRGGKHFIFRQPASKGWRSSTGRLAPRVDTRADGGYILVAPSVVGGKPYRWAEGRLLDVARDHLPAPPEWLASALDEIAAPGGAQPASAPPSIPVGQRNNALARLAGTMRRAGMSGVEIRAALDRVNLERCSPPLSAFEIAHIAESISRYEPNAISVALIEDHFAQDRAAPRAEPQSVRELLAQCPMLRPPVIIGLLRRGETMNVIAPSKTGKSWLVLALAMAVATGKPWLGAFTTIPGRVLIIDNELHRETLAHRIPAVAEALGVGLDEIGERIDVQSLRGQLRDIMSMGAYFEQLQPGRYALIILDAFYRFMPMGGDENDNGTMANIYNRIDAFADRVGCSFVLIHHTTKGNQSQKSVTDVGAGAGSQSRATDTHLVLRPHEEAEAVVLEAAARSWPPVEPMALRWVFPVWKPDHDLDPAALRSERPKRRKAADESNETKPSDWTVERFVESFISDSPVSKVEIREAAKDEPGLSWRRVSDLLELAESQGLIRCQRAGRGGRMLYSQIAGEEALS